MPKAPAIKLFHPPTLSGLLSSPGNAFGDDSVLLNVPFIEWCKGLKIKSEKGLIPFELFDWQEKFSTLILGNPRIPISLLSSRQTGKTALVLALLVWLSLSRHQFTAVVIHRKGDDVRQLARRCKKFIPDTTKLESDSLSLIEFSDTGSQLHFRSCNPRNEDGAEQVGRGLNSVDIAVIEEASHTSNVSEIMTVLGPCLTWSPMATVLQIGTAGRKETAYYSGLCDAFQGTNNLESTLENIRSGEAEPYQVARSENRIAVITNWRSIPRFRSETDYLGRIKKEQDLSEAQVSSEHELIFDSDKTLSVFDFKLVQKAIRGQWEAPQDGAVYFAAVDGSGRPKNKKGDYTACLIIKKLESGKFQVVKMYRKRGVTFAERYAAICEMLNLYAPIQTLVEANDGMGQQYHENISEGCPDLLIERFPQTDVRKAGLVGKISLALENDDIGIPKSAIVDELLCFSELDGGKLGAVGKDAHDDTVIALGMALESARYRSI